MLTVVDNGSDTHLQKELIELHKKNIIHHVYLLDKNYGVSCACNVGWKQHPAPFCMKLDNDMEVISSTWLNDIFGMWGRNRYNTIFGPVWGCDTQAGRCDTEHGTYWQLPVSFSGAALITSKKVIDAIGYFCEDYGLYGEEDADYCLRGHQVNIRKYTFACSQMILHTGHDDAEYHTFDVDKKSIHNENIGNASRKGIFAMNVFMYTHKLKNVNVPLKYSIGMLDGYNITMHEDPEYKIHHEKLYECMNIFNNTELDDREKILSMSKKVNT